MSAPARVSIEAIKESLKTYGGNVSAVATHVGMTRSNLHERLQVAGIKAEDYRATRPRTTPVRLGDESLEALRQAAIDLAYLRRRDYAPGQVLEEFIGEALEAWLAAKKGKAR